MKAERYSIDGKKLGTITLSDKIFSVFSDNFSKIQYEVVNTYLANQRVGSASVKFRSEIHGSRRKLFRQKGTGNARVGDKKTIIRRGGGRAFGPKPKNWHKRIPKKVKRLSLKLALSQLAKVNGVCVIEDFTFSAPSTKKAKTILESVKTKARKRLLIVDSSDKNIVKSFENLEGIKLWRADSLHSYLVLNSDCLILTDSALKKVSEVFK